MHPYCVNKDTRDPCSLAITHTEEISEEQPEGRATTAALKQIYRYYYCCLLVKPIKIVKRFVIDRLIDGTYGPVAVPPSGRKRALQAKRSESCCVSCRHE